MKLLLDTHLLLWAGSAPQRLSRAARALLTDPENELMFSAASLWEVAIKSSRARKDFRVDASLLRRALLDNGYTELAISSEHAANLTRLPPIHRDPFDRMLVVQAIVEGIVLVTSDKAVAAYPGPIRKV